MEQITKDHLDDILEFERAIKKMYLKLADLEFEEKKESEEYQSFLELLESVERIEKKKFSNIYIDANAYDRMLAYFTKDNEKTDILNLIENQDYIEGIRLNNILSIIALQNNAFLTEEDLNSPLYGETLKEEFISRKYRDAYEECISRNSIFTIDNDIKKMPDGESKKYFIYLKYFNIYISPTYEIAFLKSSGNVLPAININHNKNQVPEYSNEEFDSCNRENLSNNIIEDLEYLLEGDDELFKYSPERLELARILSLNKARLITLQDRSFIITIKKTFDNIISEDDEYQEREKDGIRKSIEQMFTESLELIDMIEEKRKLELK